MPYRVEKRAGLWRLICSKTGKVAKAKNHKHLDGGGYRQKAEAVARKRALREAEGKLP